MAHSCNITHTYFSGSITKHACREYDRAHLSTNRLAAPEVGTEVQRLARPPPLPLAVFFGVEQRFAHHLPLLNTHSGKTSTAMGSLRRHDK